MNFLAHLYLSKSNTNILIGNFIADHIKGNKFQHFHPEIQQGIRFHRQIDTFTDTHEIVKKSKRRLHKQYGHYNGVIIDIFYDYFLAKNWNTYSAIPLDIYTNTFYALLQKNKVILPEKTTQLMPYMLRHNWLYNYQYLKGIESVLEGMNRRTKGKSKMNLAIEDLKNLSTEFEEDFTLFFEDLRIFCHQKLKEITSNELL